MLRFDLPGVDPDSIEVTVDRGVLTVSARRAEEYGEGESPFIRERVMGSFTRRVYLADTLDSEKIDAAYVKRCSRRTAAPAREGRILELEAQVADLERECAALRAQLRRYREQG